MARGVYLARLQDDLSRSTMSSPMEEEFQPMWCQSWSVSDLSRIHRRECVAQFDARQHSWVGVASSPGGVARVAAGRIESACVCDIS